MSYPKENQTNVLDQEHLKVRPAAEKARKALARLADPQFSNEMLVHPERKEQHPLIAEAYRECAALASAIGIEPSPEALAAERAPDWFPLAVRNVIREEQANHRLHKFTATLAIAATVAVAPENNQPNGSRHSTDGTVAILWDNDAIALEIEGRPGAMPTYSLRLPGDDRESADKYPHKRGYVRAGQHELRDALRKA